MKLFDYLKIISKKEKVNFELDRKIIYTFEIRWNKRKINERIGKNIIFLNKVENIIIEEMKKYLIYKKFFLIFK